MKRKRDPVEAEALKQEILKVLADVFPRAKWRNDICQQMVDCGYGSRAAARCLRLLYQSGLILEYHGMYAITTKGMTTCNELQVTDH